MDYMIYIPIVNSTALNQGGTISFIRRCPALYGQNKTSDRSPRNVIKRANVARHISLVQKELSFRIPNIPPESRPRVAQIVNSIGAAYTLAWPKVQFGLRVNGANILATKPILQLWRWVMRTYVGSGEQFVATRLKSLANHCRYYAGLEQLGEPPDPMGNCPWVREGRFSPEWLFRGSISRKANSSRCFIRLSRMSRAFPAGGPDASHAALAAHLNEVTRTVSCPPTILSRVRQITVKVTANAVPDISGPGVTLSNSACYESSRRQGGAAAHIRSILWRFNHQVACRDLNDILIHSPIEEEGYTDLCLGWIDGEPGDVRRVLKFTHLSMRSCEFGCVPGTSEPQSAFRKVPEHNVVAVPDRGGFKTRVITSAPACLQAMAHIVRKVLYRNVLTKTPTRWGIRENGVTDFLRQLRLPADREKCLGPWVALSSDLTAATDRFPHDIVETINDSIESNLSESDRTCANWFAWRSLSGPQILHYPPQLKGVGVVTTTCGNMMGTAPSWFHLNLVNLSLFRCAWAMWYTNSTRRELLEVPGGERLMRIGLTSEAKTACLIKRALEILGSKGLNPFTFPRYTKFNDLCCIVGDDLCAACPFAVAVLYEIFVEACNAKLSKGKHYLQPWADGAFILVAEEIGVVQGDSLELVGAEHLRGIVSPADYAHTRADRRDQPWANVGNRLATALNAARPQLFRPLCSIAHSVTNSLRVILLKAGLPVYLPTVVGGLGWPHPKGLRYGLDRTSINSLQAYSDLRGFRSDVVRFSIEIARIRSCWMSGAIATDYAELTTICRDALSSWKTSHDDKGRLAPLTETHRIGLRNESLPCVALSKVIDQYCMQGVVVRYLTDLEALSTPTPESIYRSASHAARLYRRACARLAEDRRRARPLVPRSDYVDFIESDSVLLNSLHILVDGELQSMLRNLDQGFDVHPMDEGIPYSTIEAE